MRITHIILLITVALMLAACPRPTIPDPEPTDTSFGNDTGGGADADGFGDNGFDGNGFEADGFGGGDFLDDDLSGGELDRIIYFDFDSSEVRDEFTDIVARHAVQLASNPGARVRLEGHTDERGSREYNIGLGERRSQSVRRMLLIQGASASQIATVSFGEERPAAEGSNEGAWAQNRRVEINYIN